MAISSKFNPVFNPAIFSAVTSILGMITALNEHIIETTPTQAQSRFKEPPSFPLSLCITLLKDFETLVEVVAQQLYGEEKKWNFIALTEAIKVLLRLVSFQTSGYRMLLHGGESVNEGRDVNDQTASTPVDHRLSRVQNINRGQNPYNLEGRALSALNRLGENVRTESGPSWLHSVQHHQEAMEQPPAPHERPSLSTFLAKRGILGSLFLTVEVLFISRPLIYILLIRKYGTRSWFPWTASFVMDIIACCGSLVVSLLWKDDKDFRLSSLEKNELRRRKLLWALYLMRDPVFTKYTRRKLEGAQTMLEPVPMIGLLTEKLVELIVGAQTRYTYMSGS